MNPYNVFSLRASPAHLFVMLFFNLAHALASAFNELLGLFKDIVSPSPSVATKPSRHIPAAFDGPRDSVLVLDASGSMMDDDWKPSRLEGAKVAAKAFVKRLSQEEPEARVAVVGYGDSARTFCGLTTAKNVSKLNRWIDQIDEMGSTNMRAGLQEALRLLRGQRQTCQVVLLTDGHNTERCPLKVAEELKEFSVVECVGMAGSRHGVDEKLLKDIASAYPDGTKRYRWIGDKQHLVEHFHNLAGRITRT